MNGDLGRVIDQICRDKGIDRVILIETLEEAIKSAVKKKFGLSDNFEVTFSDELGEIEVFQFKEVVEEVTNEKLEINSEEAKQLDPESEIGDELGVKMDTEDFGRIAAQSAKQVIIQRMKDAERDIVYEDFKDREGEIINGIVQRFDKGNIIVNLGRTDAILPNSEQVPRENYRQGDRVRALIIEVKQISRGPQIVLSRTHPNFLKALFEIEVPEISDKIVNIVAVAREPGSRSKIAVVSEDRDIDPVGACVGMRGSRVQSVVQELKGEKIDIIPYNPDPARFIVNALAPAVVSRVVMDEANRTMEVIVPDEQLSLAIGRKGQNVRLASKISGWRIDVKNETKYERIRKEDYQSLLGLPGMNEKLADALYDAGFNSAVDLITADNEELTQFLPFDEEGFQALKEAATEYAANVKIEPSSSKEADSKNATGLAGDTASDLEKAEAAFKKTSDEPVSEEATAEEATEEVEAAEEAEDAADAEEEAEAVEEESGSQESPEEEGEAAVEEDNTESDTSSSVEDAGEAKEAAEDGEEEEKSDEDSDEEK